MGQLSRYNRNSGRDLLSQIHHDFDRLLAPFEMRGWEWPEASGAWIPSIDVKEEPKQYVIYADVPGVKASDIEVNMENGVLTIKGTRESEKYEYYKQKGTSEKYSEKHEYKQKGTKENYNYLRMERMAGTFFRQLSLPEAVDQTHIEAKCHDGVLKIVLPKTAHSVGHKIKVKDE